MTLKDEWFFVLKLMQANYNYNRDEGENGRGKR